MGFTSIWHWIIVLLIVLLLFGAGKLPKVMGDLAKGIKNFKAGLKDESDDEAPAQPAAAATPLPNQAAAPVVPPAAPTAAAPTVAPTATPGAAPTAAPGTDPGLKKDETART